MDWQALETTTSVLVNVSILAAAVVAVIKLRLFNLLAHRFRSELVCKHYDVQGGDVVFVGEYSIFNTGQRPIHLSQVTLTLVPSGHDAPLLVPDRSRVLAQRTILPSDSLHKGLFRIEPDERTIFTMRCRLSHLEDVVFLLCSFTWPHGRDPAPFVGLYVKQEEQAEGVK